MDDDPKRPNDPNEVLRTPRLAIEDAFEIEVGLNLVRLTLKAFHIKLEFTYRAFATFRSMINAVDLAAPSPRKDVS